MLERILKNKIDMTKVEEKNVKDSLKGFKKLLKIAYIPYNELLKEGFFAGIGWSFGVTIGFVIISTILVFILKSLGGLPFIGSFLANIVAETQIQLSKRTPIFQ